MYGNMRGSNYHVTQPYESIIKLSKHRHKSNKSKTNVTLFVKAFDESTIHKNDDRYKAFNDNDVPEKEHGYKEDKESIVGRQRFLSQRLFSVKGDLFEKTST